MAAREGVLSRHALRTDESRPTHLLPSRPSPPPKDSESVGEGATGSLPSLPRSTVVLTSLAAGAAAGALAKTAIAPLDRAKINFQTSQTPYSWRLAVSFLRHTLATEGVIALWRGNSATMARIVPYAAIQFTAHEQWKRVLGVDTPSSAQANPLIHLCAGSLAGVTSQSLTYPLDLARARMAVTSARQYATLRAVFISVVKDEGVSTLYRGYPATVLGVIPYAGVSFFTYDSLKHKYMDYFNTTPSGMVNVAFGGVAGALGQTASYPLDIVRRRMQTARSGNGAKTINIDDMQNGNNAKTIHASTKTNDNNAKTLNANTKINVDLANGNVAKSNVNVDVKRDNNAKAIANVKEGVNAVRVCKVDPSVEGVVRTRIPDIAHCRTIPDTLKHVYRTEGIRGFFKGLSMNWVKGPIAVGISFATYDAIKTALRDLALRIESS